MECVKEYSRRNNAILRVTITCMFHFIVYVLLLHSHTTRGTLNLLTADCRLLSLHSHTTRGILNLLTAEGRLLSLHSRTTLGVGNLLTAEGRLLSLHSRTTLARVGNLLTAEGRLDLCYLVYGPCIILNLKISPCALSVTSSWRLRNGRSVLVPHNAPQYCNNLLIRGTFVYTLIDKDYVMY